MITVTLGCSSRRSRPSTSSLMRHNSVRSSICDRRSCRQLRSTLNCGVRRLQPKWRCLPVRTTSSLDGEAEAANRATMVEAAEDRHDVAAILVHRQFAGSPRFTDRRLVSQTKVCSVLGRAPDRIDRRGTTWNGDRRQRTWLRFWFEVSTKPKQFQRANRTMHQNPAMWFPYQKGWRAPSLVRKQRCTLSNWENDGAELFAFRDRESVIRNARRTSEAA